jgi:hypothetical protein
MVAPQRNSVHEHAPQTSWIDSMNRKTKAGDAKTISLGAYQACINGKG